MAGVEIKLRRALEARRKLEQERLKKLEEKRQKEEERKKNVAKIEANNRKMQEMNRRDREEKRKQRLEAAHKQQKELEEQLRATEAAKEERHRALLSAKRKAIEEETKKQCRIEKEKKAAQQRRRIEEVHHKTTLQAQKGCPGKVLRMSTSCAKATFETEGQSMWSSNANSQKSSKSNTSIESYEIVPCTVSDEDDSDDDVARGKFIPSWARKENLIQHIISQEYIDPDEIFTGARTFILNEVFESNESNTRRDFERRSYSGEWLNDSLTREEEYLYKLQMGYIHKG